MDFAIDEIHGLRYYKNEIHEMRISPAIAYHLPGSTPAPGRWQRTIYLQQSAASAAMVGSGLAGEGRFLNGRPDT